jgi:glycosyltransferase involved in cell wall biosynthesis
MLNYPVKKDLSLPNLFFSENLFLFILHMMNNNNLESLLSREKQYNDYEYPKVSIILPTYNCRDIVSITLEKVLEQSYPNLEVIVVDAGSQDSTLEVIKRFRDDRVEIYSTSEQNRYSQINTGLTQAKGEYINILFPGDYYLHKNTLTLMMELAIQNEHPSLVFCGTLLRREKSEPEILYRKLSLPLLKQGKQPTSLQACWFKKRVFQEIGKFNTTYKLRGGFDFLCRYCKKLNHKTVSKNRILLDYDLKRASQKETLTHFKETYRIIKTHFGQLRALKWLFIQEDIHHLFKELMNRIKSALFKP